MYGLVLEGGGGKGAYHIGVYRALLEMNIPISAITGTSVGALNGAFIAQGDFEKAYDLWYHMDPGLVINTDTATFKELVHFNFSFNELHKYYRYVKEILQQSGLDIQPLKNLITTYADEERLRNSSIGFGLVTVSLDDLKAIEVFIEDIPSGELANYLLASSYLPGFKGEELNGKRYIDGSFYDNLPINLITRKGITDIIVVHLNAIGRKKSPKKKDLNLIEIMPSGDTGKILNFDVEQSRENLLMGYYDTLRTFNKAEGFRYCITNLPDEAYYLQKLIQLDDKTIRLMSQELGIKSIYPRRDLFEKILPRLAKVFQCDNSTPYRLLLLKILENLAELLSIPRYCLYRYEEFLDLLRSNANELDASLTSADFFHQLIRNAPVDIPSGLLTNTAIKKNLILRLAQLTDILPQPNE